MQLFVNSSNIEIVYSFLSQQSSTEFSYSWKDFSMSFDMFGTILVS